jgi:hypothetical protein
VTAELAKQPASKSARVPYGNVEPGSAQFVELLDTTPAFATAVTNAIAAPEGNQLCVREPAQALQENRLGEGGNQRQT